MVGLPRELAWVAVLFLPTVDLVRCLRVCRYFRLLHQQVLLEGWVWPHEVRVASFVLPPPWVQRMALDVRVDTAGVMVDAVLACLERVTRLRIVGTTISSAVTFPEQLQELELDRCTTCERDPELPIRLPVSLRKYRVHECTPVRFFWINPDEHPSPCVPMLESLEISVAYLPWQARPMTDFQTVCGTRLRVVGINCHFEGASAHTGEELPNQHLQELTLFKGSRELPDHVRVDLPRLFPNLRVLRLFNCNGAMVPVHLWPEGQLLEVDLS